MILTHTNICNYLITKDLISIKSIVEGDLMILDTSSRNTNFLINQFGEGGQKLFVKQPDIEDEKYIKAMQIKSEIYEFIHTHPICSKLRKFVPKLCHYDSENHILVMEQLTGVCRAFDYIYHALNYPDQTIIRSLAIIMSNMHRISGIETQILKPVYPWFLDSMDKNYIARIKKDNRKAYKILRPIFENPEVIQFVRDTKAMWQSTYFIHLDTRLTNWMMPYTYQSGQDCSLWLIDFEMAGIGDAAWDIGFLFGDLLIFDSYLQFQEVKIETDKSPLSIHSIPEATQFFWKIYKKLISTNENFTERVIRYTAIKILMAVYEHIVDEEDISMDYQLKILIELFFDMVGNTKMYHSKLLGI